MTDATMNQEERAALRDTVRRLFADQCTESDVRRIMESDSGHDPALWRSLAELFGRVWPGFSRNFPTVFNMVSQTPLIPLL